MRIHLLLALTAALLLSCGIMWGTRESVSAIAKAEVRGTVVFTDGVRQRDVNGRCVSLERFNKYYAPGVPEQFDSAIKFGNEWHAGDDGAFTLSLAPGEYVLWAHGARHKAVKLTVTKGDRSLSVEVIGRSGNTIAPFRFLTPEGAPIRSTRVHGDYEDYVGMRTIKDGVGTYRSRNFELTTPASRFLWVKDVGYATATINQDDLLRPDPIDIRLRKGTYVSGTVRSKSTGAPLGGVVVFPVRDRKKGDPFAYWNEMLGSDPYSFLSSRSEAAATSRDGDGAFTLGPLPPGDYSVLFTLPSAPLMEFRELLAAPLHVVEGETPEPLNVKVPVKATMCRLRGRVLDGSSGKPIADAMVTVGVQSTYPADNVEHWDIWEPVVRRVKTDRKGEFTLYPLDPRKLVFDVSWKGISVEKRVMVSSAGKTVDFVLRPRPPEPGSRPSAQPKKL